MTAADGEGGPTGEAVDSDRLSRTGLWLSLLLTAGIALPRILTTSMSVDEAYSMDTAGRNLSGTLHQSLHFELQPPLYFLLLNLWLRLWQSPEFARGFSLGCVLLALIVLSRIGRRLGGGWGTALLPLFMALLAPVAWSAVTARGYALTLLLLALCLHGFVDLWWDDRTPSRGALPLFLGSGIAAIGTQYYSGFAIGGLLLWAALSGRRRRELTMAAVAFALVVLALVPLVRTQAALHPALPENGTPGSRFNLAPTVLLFGGLFWTGMVRRALGIVALAGGFVLLMGARVAAGSPRWSRVETQVLAAALFGWGALLALQLSGIALVLPRHRLVTVPLLLLLLAVVIDRVQPAARGRLAALGATLLLALFFISYQVNTGDFDWRTAARIVQTHETPGEAILGFPSDAVLPLRWEYRGLNRLHGLPADPSLERYDPADHYLRDGARVAAAVDAAVGDGQSYWLIRRGWLPAAAGDTLLDAYLQSRSATIARWSLDGIEVLHLRRRNRPGGSA